jgi:replication factor C subunit 1
MVRLSRTTLSYDEVRGAQGATKDTDQSPFEVARRLLEPASGNLSINDRMDLVFEDMGKNLISIDP